MTAARPAPRSDLRLRALAVAGAFMMNGASFGIWAARIPAVKEQTGLSTTGLGFALLGASIGAVLTMTFGGWLGNKFGTHVMTSLTAVGAAVMTVFIGASWDFASLTIALLIFGVLQGTMDVSMNANGIAVEQAGAGPIMSRLHASWSIGAFCGALASTQVAALGIAVLPEFAVAAAFLVIGGVILRFTMMPDKHTGGGGRLRLPTGPLAVIGALAMFGLMAEGSATDWSGLYLQTTMNASPGLAGLAVTTFTGSMAVARLAGDRLSLRLGSARLVSGGAALAAAGLALALAVQIPAIAIVGFGMMGLGLAAVVPTLFRAAGSQPGIPASAGIAAVSTMGYAGGLIGPPFIGTVAGVATLRGSLVIILLMLAILTIGGRLALNRSASGPSRPSA